MVATANLQNFFNLAIKNIADGFLFLSGARAERERSASGARAERERSASGARAERERSASGARAERE
ncbi:MAG: hypothetical protein FWE23_11010, partial [Chitinivibrionia bacterium]|nr:hypothetical protein [Chitinivibrionia bacterium]